MSVILIPGPDGTPLPRADYNNNLDAIETSLGDLGAVVLTGLVPSIGTGLSVNVSAGTANIGGRVTKASTFTIGSLAPSTTNHLYLLQDGTATSNTTGTQPANSTKLGTALTGVATVTSVAVTRASGRQTLVRHENLQLGGGAGHPAAGDLSSWHASNTEGNQFRGVLPAGAIPGGLGDQTFTAAYASRPAASQDGNLFLPNNGFVLERDTGAAWSPWGPLFPFTDPNAQSWTLIDSGTLGQIATVTTTQGQFFFRKPGHLSAADNSLRVITTPTPPYTFTVAYLPLITKRNYNRIGLVWYETGSTKMQVMAWLGDAIDLSNWNNPGSFSATIINYPVGTCPLFWRLTDDNTNRIFSISSDGQNFMDLHTFGRTTFITPDRVGIFLDAENAASPNPDVGMTVLSVKVA